MNEKRKPMPRMVDMTCANPACGKQFQARAADVSRGRQFCGKSCAKAPAAPASADNPSTAGAATMRPSDDELWDQTLRQRDHAQEMADKLAEAIAKYFDAEIGEHSNINCPWHEALDVIDSYQNHQPVAAQALNPSEVPQDDCDHDFGRVGIACPECGVIPSKMDPRQAKKSGLKG